MALGKKTFLGVDYDLDTTAGKAAYGAAVAGLGADEQTIQELANQQYSQQFGGGMSQAELRDFETLIGRLEGSKMKQAGQANRARQRDVMAGGLASMMANF
jgi:hypothetical protein